MREILCINCNKINKADEALEHIYCQYCGQKLFLKDENREIVNVLEKLLSHKDPVYIHDQLLELDKKFPNNLDIKKAILLQGRLHERSPKHFDFSVIHCYLLNVFLEKETKKGQKDRFIDELMYGSNLLECLRIADNKNKFLQEYYFDLSTRYIELFLMGSNKYMKQYFGLTFSRNPAKSLAEPSARMIKNILSEQKLKDYRFVLAKALYEAFGKKFANEYRYLNDELGDSINLILGEYRNINL